MLTGCMIVKNGGEELALALRSLAPFVDETVVYDTGSTDGSQDVAVSLGARLVQGTWNDHFAEARNLAARQATHDLLLVADADERVEGDPAGVREKLAQSPGAAAALCRVMTLQNGQIIGGMNQFRVYDRRRVEYFGRVHNELISLDGSRLPVLSFADADLRILHAGYSGGRTEAKNPRNLRMLEMAWSEGDRREQVKFHLARSLLIDGQKERALPLFKECIKEKGYFGEMSAVLLVERIAARALEAAAFTDALAKEELLEELGTALFDVERIQTMFPENPELLRHLVTIYAALGIAEAATRAALLLRDAPRTWGGLAAVEFVG